MDIPANYPNGLYYKDGDNKVPISNGAKLKAGTVIYYEDSERSYQTVAYVDVVKIDYNGIPMPNKAITVDIIVDGYTPNFIPADRIANRPSKWVTLTVNTGEGRLYKYRNTREYETNASIKFYVNPLYSVNILYGSGETAYLAGYNLFAPEGKFIKTRIYGKISTNKEINIEYEKKPDLTLTLHNSNDQTKVINITEKTTYQDILSQIRAAETKAQGKKFVCWSVRKNDLKGFDQDMDYINLESTIIYPQEYDKYLDKDYSSAINANYYYNQDKINVDLYEITTDAENHVVRQFKLNEYTKLNGEIEKYFSIKDTYIVKKDGKSGYQDEDIKYENIIWFGKDDEDNFYKILNFDNFSVEKLSKDTKVTEDSNVAFKNAWKETESRERIDVYSSLEVEGDPKLDYTDEDNPKLDLSHMVLGIYEENKAPFYLPFENFGTEVTVEPANGTPLSYDQYNGKSIKVMYKNKIAYTGKLIINNDGFDKDNITNITIKTQPTTYYKIDKDPSETKLDLNKLVVTLTSPKKGSTSQEEVTRDVPYAKFDDYGLKVSMPNDETPAVYSDVDNNTILNITDNEKKLKVYINDNIFVETDKITVKDGVFRIENTKSIETKTEPTTKYVVGEMLDLDDLVLTFTDENDNTKDFTYEDLKKLGFNFALCGEDKKPPKTDEEIQKEFEEVINPMFEDVKSKEGVYEGSFDPQTRTVTVKILDKTQGAKEISGTGIVAGLTKLYKENNLVKLKVGNQVERDLKSLADSAPESGMTVEQLFKTVFGADILNSVQTEGNKTGTLADFIDKEVILTLTVLDSESNKEVTIDYTIKGVDGTPKAPEKTEEEIKEEFEKAINPMFAGVASKDGVYAAEFDETTKTVTVKILDKTKKAMDISGTGIVAGLTDLYKNNNLIKVQFGSQEERDLKTFAEAAPTSGMTVEQMFKTVFGADIMNEFNKENKSGLTLGDLIGKSVTLKLTVKDPDSDREVVLDYSISAEDGTPEETPNPGEGTTGNDEETLPNSNEEALTNPAGGGNGQGETCTPIDNVDKLELKDDGKKITITGPVNHSNRFVSGFEAEYEITVEDKLKITYVFKSSTEGKDLPDEVKNLLPTEELVNPNSDYTAKSLNSTEVKVEGGTWTFKGWEPANITKITENKNIIGTWEFVKDEEPNPNPDPNPNPNP
ncbi:SHIRT domain-containing protein, partial [uncultured Fenollaria sp.]|uniref:SHIRT domain-containing protein n=1 Tax=uncultured Fenollaria sp. TaxID=1686315 RepID=UPI0025DD9508